MTAMTLAGWVIVMGSYLVIGFSLAMIIGTVVHRRDEEQAEWHAAHQRPPREPMQEITYWIEDDPPTWNFRIPVRPYDQSNGTPETREPV